MRVIADLHVHSPFSRAVSADMTIPNLDVWGVKKGLKIIGTGDFTHPKWFAHLEEHLEPAESGLYKVKNSSTGTRFLATVEISSIYSDGGRVRRVHNLIFAPSLEIAQKVTDKIKERGGKVASDGRPIVGLSSRELLNIALEADQNCFFVPAHVWTPWFAVFGSKSGYDSLEEAFGEDVKYIKAVETGLSSDPEMNWRISALDKVTLISNSDPHSLRRLARECNVFEIEPGNLSYYEVVRVIKEKDKDKFLFTVEYFPEEGRYHYDGDREHAVCLSPQESKKLQRRCPQCGRELTIGVLSRVEDLADRPDGFKPTNAIPGKHLVQLEEIIADSLGLSSASGKKVQDIYHRLVDNFPGGELGILLDADEDTIKNSAGPYIAEGVRRVRAGELHVSPGYDGVYGRVQIFTPEERSRFTKTKIQSPLF